MNAKLLFLLLVRSRCYVAALMNDLSSSDPTRQVKLCIHSSKAGCRRPAGPHVCILVQGDAPDSPVLILFSGKDIPIARGATLVATYRLIEDALSGGSVELL